MIPVDIGKLRSALVQETRGQYIGGVDPHTFVESFMKWNPDIDTSFKAEKPSRARLGRLIGMAGKPENAMNKDWVSCRTPQYHPLTNTPTIARCLLWLATCTQTEGNPAPRL